MPPISFPISIWTLWDFAGLLGPAVDGWRIGLHPLDGAVAVASGPGDVADEGGRERVQGSRAWGPSSSTGYPLPRRAAQILGTARTLGNGGALIFPGVCVNRLSDIMFSKFLKELELGAVPHGFCSSFRDWAADETNPPARGGRGRARPRDPEQGRGSLRAVGLVRAASPPDG